MKTEIIDAVAQLHQSIDARASALSRLHADRLQCRRGCSGCCTDELTVWEVEAAMITTRHADVLKEAPHPAGACAFLDADGGCRVYADRPYVCRTQGLPLRWIERQLADDGVMEVLEYRDICTLNDVDPPIEILDPEVFWTIGPIEEALADLQDLHGAPERVALRSLFTSAVSPG
ncbi:MAG: YkgJ family cysteine cluster protein [Myxococcota bacterium]|nr:YkgJ family cysteine cluster protein [Myxococcota bacterium]